MRSFRFIVHRTGLTAIALSIIWSASAIAQSPAARPTPFEPDAVAVTRYGPASRFPQDGWIVVHIEGAPYERGVQHGRLLAREIVDYCNQIAKVRSHLAPDKAWRDLRLFVNALFLRRFDPEYLREMQGIADGAAAAGAKLDGRLIDLIDIVVINADVEVGYLESALEGTATGIDREDFGGRHGSPTRAKHRDRCSAFIATGPATAGGKIVAGHITMSELHDVKYFNVWLDIQPSAGHRMVFQTFPGGIQSGLDYYVTDAGLIVSETTIEQTRFDPQGEMLASRIRRAVQYADSIDKCIEILTSSSNGLYTNEWLFGDIKTNEIAMFELGTRSTRLWRSSRNEWVAGTKGFYWGCNNVKDVGVFKETVADFGAKPQNLVLHPRLRDEAWIKLFHLRQGSISEAFGFEAFSTAPIVGFPSCDAKFTTAELAKDLKSWALFGPPLGRTWFPSESDREDLPTIQPLVANEWTLIDVKGAKLPAVKSGAAGKGTSQVAVDLEMFPAKEEPLHVEYEASHPFAWRGTLLPKTDADIWLASAFAEFEHVIALDHAVLRHIVEPGDEVDSAKDSQKRSGDCSSHESDESVSSSSEDEEAPSREGRNLVDLALFQHESKWLTAVRRVGRDTPLVETKSDPENGDWYRLAAGKGVMLLSAIRDEIGLDEFIRCLDQFGRTHAGREVTTDQFRSHLQETVGSAAVKILDRWLTEDMSVAFASKNPWSIFSHEVEPERVLIVYGTLRDKAAQKEAAIHLQTEVVRRFANLLPPIKSDLEVSDDELGSHYLLLVGHAFTNRISGLVQEKSSSFPVRFGRQSLTIADETYAHPETWVIAAGENPFNRRYSAVVFAGLGAASTWRSVRNLLDPKEPGPQIILNVTGKRPRMFRASVSRDKPVK